MTPGGKDGYGWHFEKENYEHLHLMISIFSMKQKMRMSPEKVEDELREAEPN